MGHGINKTLSVFKLRVRSLPLNSTKRLLGRCHDMNQAYITRGDIMGYTNKLDEE